MRPHHRFAGSDGGGRLTSARVGERGDEPLRERVVVLDAVLHQRVPALDAAVLQLLLPLHLLEEPLLHAEAGAEPPLLAAGRGV